MLIALRPQGGTPRRDRSKGHDRWAARDNERLRSHDIRAARDGIRWHLIERKPGRYDVSSVLPVIRAARETGMQVIWDLCHYGWPEDLDIFSAAFVDRFARFARAFAAQLSAETDESPFFVPINEISFFAWAGGDVGYFNPFATNRGDELKAQLVRAAIAATEAVWDVRLDARIMHLDPLINVLPDPARPEERAAAEAYRLAQYQSWDMLSGRLSPELGGHDKYLDIMGVNYYPQNQWVHGRAGFDSGGVIGYNDPRYRPFADMLKEVYERYRRPILISETGADDDARPAWLRYVSEQVRDATRMGVPVEGICLYLVVNFPWWDTGQHLHSGLWDYPPGPSGGREIYRPLAEELRRQRRLFDAWAPTDDVQEAGVQVAAG
jgi:beta-glucosidase/6-phospho-beta-glucosidase/beta-galactosidase